MNWTSQADTLIDDVDVAHCARPDWTLNKNGPKPGGRHHSPVSAQAGWSGKSFEPRRGSRVPPAAAQGRGARRPDQRPLHRPGWRRPRLLPVPRRPARATACLLPARRRLPGDAARRRHDLVAKEFVTAQAAGEGAAALVLRSAYPRTMWAPDYPWGRTEEEYRREWGAIWASSGHATSHWKRCARACNSSTIKRRTSGSTTSAGAEAQEPSRLSLS